MYTYNLRIYGIYDSVNPTPLIRILSLSSDDAKALQDVDNVINTPFLNTQLFGALIK